MAEERAKVTKSARRPIAVALVVVLALIVVLAARGLRRQAPPKAMMETPISVQTYLVSRSLLQDDVSASGTVRPVIEAKIAPRIASNVEAVYVHEGDHVRPGQVLVRLESRDLRAQVQQALAAVSTAAANANRATTAIDLQKAQTSTGIASAKAALAAARENLSLVKAGPRKQQRIQAQLATAQAKAQLDNAQTELGRMQRLYDEGVIAKQRLDATRTAYEVAKAQYESAVQQANMTEEGSRIQEIRAAEEQVRQAEEALRMAKASTVQNTISVRNAQAAASQVLQAKAALQAARVQLSYATIVSPIAGVVSVRNVDLGDTVSPGVPIMTVESDALYRLEATVPADSIGDLSIGKPVDVTIGAEGRKGIGKVSVISPAGDPGSHTFLVRVDLPASLGARSGNFGRVHFAAGMSQGITVPDKALRDEGGLPTVYVVDKENRARMRAVKVGRRMGGMVEVLSELNPGDHVIVDSAGDLADGVAVAARGR